MGSLHRTLRKAVLVDEQLKVYGTEPFMSVVLDVASPGLALDVDDDATDWSLEVHRHKRAQVSLGVLERVIVSGEAPARVVLDRSDVLDIGRVLTLARHPHRVHGVLFLLLDGLDVVLELGRHVVGQGARIVVKVRNPSVDLVQLQEYAGGALVVVVLVLQGARSVLLDVHVAHGPRRGSLGVITVVDVLASARDLSGRPVILQEFVQSIGPLLVVLLLGALVPDQGTLDVVFGW